MEKATIVRALPVKKQDQEDLATLLIHRYKASLKDKIAALEQAIKNFKWPENWTKFQEEVHNHVQDAARKKFRSVAQAIRGTLELPADYTLAIKTVIIKELSIDSKEIPMRISINNLMQGKSRHQFMIMEDHLAGSGHAMDMRFHRHPAYGWHEDRDEVSGEDKVILFAIPYTTGIPNVFKKRLAACLAARQAIDALKKERDMFQSKFNSSGELRETIEAVSAENRLKSSSSGRDILSQLDSHPLFEEFKLLLGEPSK